MIGAIGLDIFAVGAASAAIGILGFSVFIANPTSITNRTFLAFSIITILWSFANFFQYNPTGLFRGIWVVRGITFLGCWHALAYFQLCYVFPEDRFPLPRWYLNALVPLVGFTSLLTLTPLVFTRVLEISPEGVILAIENGPGIAIFGFLSLALVIGGSFLLMRRTYFSDGLHRKQLGYMSVGALFTFVCIMTFNMILPAMFDIARFIPLTAIFLAPFAALTAYSILQHKLFNVKVAGTAALVFLLAALIFVEVIFSTELYLVLVRVGILLLVLSVGVSLIRSVHKEIEQREIIERLSEEKSEFMTFASHELRNPITAMRGYASLITDGTVGDVAPQIKDVAQRILVMGNEVLQLIAEYLNKSKLELGKMSFNNDRFNLGAAVTSIVEGYKPHAQQKGLTIAIDIDTNEHIFIKADEARIKEVVGNLIDNSIKYTPHGTVTVSVHRHGVNARAIVSDTGVGIPKETLPHLFGKFSRADAQKVNLLGTGIGLYLAKQITEAMGGHIWAESDGNDKGSRFIIEFPLTGPAA